MKRRKKEAFASGPKKVKGAAEGPGKKATAAPKMGGLFGSVTPKKPEFDKPAPSKATQAASRSARMKRLDKQFI